MLIFQNQLILDEIGKGKKACSNKTKSKKTNSKIKSSIFAIETCFETLGRSKESKRRVWKGKMYFILSRKDQMIQKLAAEICGY